MRINTDINSLVISEAFTSNTYKMNSSLEKLSSGFAINKASDNASGLAIADKLRTQASSYSQAIKNTNSAIAVMQIADKAMSEQSNILDIVKTKLVQAATSTTSAEGRKSIAQDINNYLNQLDNIASKTNYDGITLLQESATSVNAANSLSFQVGGRSSDTIIRNGNIQANTSGLASSSPTDTLADLKTDTSGDGSSLTRSISSNYLSIIDLALTDLNTMRSDFGTVQNQLESSLRNTLTMRTNLKAAESVIRDVDYAQESANFEKNKIIGQAISYAHSQANAIPKSVLTLLP